MPKGVTRSWSEAEAPLDSCACFIVRNLTIAKGVPRSPNRCCRKIIGRPCKINAVAAMPKISGENRRRRPAAAVRSNARLSNTCRRVLPAHVVRSLLHRLTNIPRHCTPKLPNCRLAGNRSLFRVTVDLILTQLGGCSLFAPGGMVDGLDLNCHCVRPLQTIVAIHAFAIAIFARPGSKLPFVPTSRPSSRAKSLA